MYLNGLTNSLVSSSKRSYFTTDMGEFYNWFNDTKEDLASRYMMVEAFAKINHEETDPILSITTQTA